MVSTQSYSRRWFALLTIAVAGCADRVDPVDPLRTIPSSVSRTDAIGATDFVVIGNGELPATTIDAIRAAAGDDVALVPQIGLAILRGADASAVATVRALPGVLAVVPDVAFSVASGLDDDAQANASESAQVEIAAGATRVTAAASAAGALAPIVVNEPLLPAQWGLRAIDAQGAWAQGAGGAGARVFILDSGIDHDHPDLAPNLNLGLSVSFVPGAPVFVPPALLMHHGTMVAGVVAAANNGIGIAGVAPNAQIVAVRVIAPDNSMRFSHLAQAIIYAADNGADVINMSLGTNLQHSGGRLGDSNVILTALEAQSIIQTLANATRYAHRKGVTIVAAAGNAGLNGEEDRDRIVIPADLPHVIAVSATSPIGFAFNQQTDLDIPFSAGNYGQSRVDIAAPGGDFRVSNPSGQQCTIVITIFCQVFDGVLTTVNQGQFRWGNATSMAAPHVSGVAAMLVGLSGGSMHPDRVESLLVRSADDLGKPGNDDYYGAGRLNARRAVELTLK